MKIGGSNKYDRFYIALATPYKKGSFDIDYEEYRGYVKSFVQEKYLKRRFSFIVNPEAGEVFALNQKERRKLMEIAREAAGPDIPIFGGVTGTTLTEAQETAVAAKETGLDGIFICPPLGGMDITTYCDFSVYPEVWLDWVLGIDAAVKMPIILHPAGMVTEEWSFGIPLDVIKETVRKCPNIVGWKALARDDKIMDYARFLREHEKETGHHVSVLGAKAYLFYHLAENDCLDGSVSCYLNFSADKMVEFFDALETDVKKGQQIMQGPLGELYKYVTDGDSGGKSFRLHTNFKVATWLRGIISNPYCRPPMPKPRKKEIVKLVELMKKVGFELIAQEKIDELLNELPR
jgi:dihydrodipicolinate synthase/N-acetylneuraminate lyase